MKNKISKNKDLLFFTFAGFVISTWGKLFLCQMPAGLGFDEQSFLYWDYLNFLNLIPYKDFFYPYGLLFFLKTDSVIWYFISIILFSISIAAIYLIFKKLFKNNYLRVLLFISFSIFLSLFQSYDSLLRYLPLLLLICFVSYLQNNNLLFIRRYIFAVGVIIGFFFSFINDLFFYSVLYLLITSTIYLALNKSLIGLNLFKSLCILISGIFIGSLPFIYYIYQNHALSGLVNNYELLKTVSVFAKVPFPSSLRSVENLFITGTIVVGLINLIAIFHKGQKKDFTFYIKLSLIIILLILEQKNLIRSFYQEISIYAMFLFLILMGELKIRLQQYGISEKKSYLYISFMICLCFLMIKIERGDINHNLIKNNFTKSCYVNKLERIDHQSIENYNEVYFYLKNKRPKVFSFPGDPVFYLKFNQLPPYYPSIYEATPFFAQRKQINYIEDQKVNYVIYNTSSTAIQDGVPDKIRGKLLFEYVKNNFELEKKIGIFEVLKRK